MDRVIKILKEQMILCTRLNEIFGELSEALKNGRSGADVTTSVQAIEPLMRDLSKSDLKVQEFLKAANVDNLKNFIESQNESIEKNVANNLLIKVSGLQDRLRHQITNVARLLINSKTFIEYNVNVLTNTVASNIYGPPGNEARNQFNRRMFDANI